MKFSHGKFDRRMRALEGERGRGTVAQFARDAEVSHAQVIRWRAGTNLPARKRWKKIAKLLGCEVVDLTLGRA